MKLENSKLKESVIKLMERRYGHVDPTCTFLAIMGNQVKEREREKKKEKQVNKPCLNSQYWYWAETSL